MRSPYSQLIDLIQEDQVGEPEDEDGGHAPPPRGALGTPPEGDN